MHEEITHPNGVREISTSALKGLAHPLRTAIYDALSTLGPQTATSLAKRLGESSGSTSYHLRQLARHRLIREVEGQHSGREKWWERIPGAMKVPGPESDLDPSTRTASHYVNRELVRNMHRNFADFVDAAYDDRRLPTDWVEASASDTSNLRLTKEQLAEVAAEYERTVMALINTYRGRNDPGSRPVQIQFYAFPLIDGEETPS
ncbi:winged helix-turn-helix domain-containing protein [Brevibacterium spongiae]|uniref:Helix-turn-helix domain-containing protein n=1 Tax=Brevibacterium spongiae TaxID=2909672 RepID=A0ABY5SQU2_9MICO|nr:helix-turn-helix domain-containing protein [Brevibacterium spongiae]UVI35476.1 helix-turn-helix domain-containing protein [Brevibacterium spongiae]